MQRKPIDVGNGRVTASFGMDGSWLSVSALHPDAGLVELVGAPAFTGADGDGDAVRAHRRRLADPAYAALRVHRAVGVWDAQRQEWEVQGHGWTGTTTAVVRTRARPEPFSTTTCAYRGRGRCASISRAGSTGRRWR